MNRAETDQPSASGVSGKLVIIGIVFVAFWAAAISWYFRYNATHRTAKFWGPDAVALIRDAPEVTLFKEPVVATERLGVAYADISATMQAHIAKSAIDISQAHGMLHLRNALLGDANFVWPGPNDPPSNRSDDQGYWWLKFHDPKSGKETIIWFTKDCRQGVRHILRPDGTYEAALFSAEPMAKGLREMFDEFSTPSSVDSGAKPQAAGDAADPAR